MPKNLRGGNKHKKGKNKVGDNFPKKEIVYAENNQLYAVVLKRFGNGRISVKCSDDRVRSAIIPGKFKKKVWLNVDDIILVDIDALGKEKDDVCLINHKYSQSDINILKNKGIIKNLDVNLSDDENIIDDDNKSGTDMIEPQNYVPDLDGIDLSDDSYESDDSELDSL